MSFDLLLKLGKIAIKTSVTAGMVAISGFAAVTPAEAAYPGYNGRIVFENFEDGNFEIYTANPDGSNRQRLTNAEANDRYPVWSPDGTKIAFDSQRDGGVEIYTMNADGTDQQNITNSSSVDRTPTWSPDGSKIAFYSNRDDNYEIYIADADGGNPTNLTNHPSSDQYPAWSPDGNAILFHSNRSGNLDLYIYNLVSEEVSQLTTDPASDGYGAWSPDGSHISFSSSRTGNWDIFVMKADGSGQTQLTTDPGLDGDSDWSPDGTRIHYTSFMYEVKALNSMKPDGTDNHRMAENQATWQGGDWQPILNSAPLVTSDTLTISYNIAGLLDVLANDTDEEALDPANLTITTQPNNGTASIVDGKVKYTPIDGYVGEDELEYQICDVFLLDQKCATGVLGITVQAGPTPATPTITRVGVVETDGTSTAYSDSNRPTFSGTSVPGASIRIEINSDPIVLTTTADEAGNWSVTPNQDIPDGEHTVTITATKDGSTSEPLTFVLGINVEQIPMTGASVSALRLWGIVLLAGGVGLHLRHRRQPLQANNHVPPLFY